MGLEGKRQMTIIFDHLFSRQHQGQMSLGLWPKIRRPGSLEQVSMVESSFHIQPPHRP
ncbi:hypothetical protein D3C87_2159610 [compost metagenome]